MKINGLIDKPKWYGIKCCCSKVDGDIEHQHPIGKCKHCQCQQAEDSMPRKDFTVIEPIFDKDGKDTGRTESRIVKEITIDRTDDGYESIRGWSF